LDSKEKPDYHLVTAVDVAKYILHKAGSMAYMKLQMLCYYSQARALAHEEIPLFSEEFLAYSCGPICKEIIEPDGHPDYFLLKDGDYGEYDDSILSEDQQESIDFTLVDYSNDHASELINLACSDLPWQAARQGISKGMDSDSVISKEDMEEFYAGLFLSRSRYQPILATIKDVARYILHKSGEASPTRLQLLCYYCQAWALAWSEIPLFKEDFLASSTGPYCKELNELAPKGFYYLNAGECGAYDDSVLSAEQKRYIDAIFDDCEPKDVVELIHLSTHEMPWLVARNGIPVNIESDAVISKEDMEECYVGWLHYSLQPFPSYPPDYRKF
jgi:uncharacterized phage-associated protein